MHYCFTRHFERNETKWSEVEKSSTNGNIKSGKNIMILLKRISPFRYASVEMTLNK